jgi:hypothetical protein
MKQVILDPPPPFIEVPVLSQESERSCICVLGVSILPFLQFSLAFWKCSESVAYLVFHFHFYDIETINDIGICYIGAINTNCYIKLFENNDINCIDVIHFMCPYMDNQGRAVLLVINMKEI